DHEDLAAFDFEVDPLEHGLTAVALAQTFHLHSHTMRGRRDLFDFFVAHLVKIHQEPRQKVIENKDQDDGVYYRLGHGAADSARTADGHQALMARHDPN